MENGNNEIFKDKDLTEALMMVDGELFADWARKVLPQVFCNATGCSMDDIRTETVEVDADQDMVDDYLLVTDEETGKPKYRDEDADDDDDDCGKKVCCREDVPDEFYYVKITYKNMEFALFLDEYGFNGDFWSGVHLQYLRSKPGHAGKDAGERLQILLSEKVDEVLPDECAFAEYSEDENCTYEDITKTAPYVDLFVMDNSFRENPVKKLTQMLRAMVSVVEEDNVPSVGNRDITKEAFIAEAEEYLKRYRQQHMNTYIEHDEAMKEIRALVDECTDNVPLAEELRLLLPQLKCKITSAEKVRDMYIHDIKHNKALNEFWAYDKSLEEGEMAKVHFLARRIGLDIFIDKNGVSYESNGDGNGLRIYYKSLDRKPENGISLWTRMFHAKDIKRIKEVIEPFWKKHVVFANSHWPEIEKVAEKYDGYTVVFQGKKEVFHISTLRFKMYAVYYRQCLEYNVYTLQAAYNVTQRIIESL